jgi:hypothetical protein
VHAHPGGQRTGADRAGARDDIEAVEVDVAELGPAPDAVVEHRELDPQIPQTAGHRGQSAPPFAIGHSSLLRTYETHIV